MLLFIYYCNYYNYVTIIVHKYVFLYIFPGKKNPNLLLELKIKKKITAILEESLKTYFCMLVEGRLQS